MIDSNMVGMLFWGTDGNIADANDAFLRTVGYDREDLRAGRIDWRKMTPPEFRELDDQALREIAATGVCQTFEKEYLRKDGLRVPIIVAGASFEEDRTRGVAFILDNTKPLTANALKGDRERCHDVGMDDYLAID